MSKNSKKSEINFHYDRYCEGDGDNTSTSWTFSKVFYRKRPKADSCDLTTKFTVDINTTYYLVYVIYSTGDSFHNHDRSECEFIELYKTKKEANACRKAIRDADHAENPLPHIIYANGEKRTMYVPWSGYFENLDECEILECKFSKGSFK